MSKVTPLPKWREQYDSTKGIRKVLWYGTTEESIHNIWFTNVAAAIRWLKQVDCDSSLKKLTVNRDYTTCNDEVARKEDDELIVHCGDRTRTRLISARQQRILFGIAKH